jgi:two-component system OmpR family sensor kinase
MSSLFVRLWVAFLIVMLLTFGASMGGVYLAAVKRAAGLSSHVSPASLASSAQQTLSARGPDGIASWTIEQNHVRPELQVYFVDRFGHEMLNRKVRGQPLIGPAATAPPVVRAPDGTSYRMLIRRTSDLVFDFWDVFFRPWMVLGLALAISAVASALIAWAMSGPVRRLRSGVRQLASGNLEVDIGDPLIRRRDELGALARDFEQMTKDLRALIMSKEELLRDVSHELRSPLARLRLAADLAREGTGDAKRSFERIDREVQKIDVLIGEILHFSRLGIGQQSPMESVNLEGLISEIVEDARIEAESKKVQISTSIDSPARIHGDAKKLRSAIENVVRNALYYAPVASSVLLSLTRAGDAFWIEVADEGPGIDEIDAERIFDPFHRGERSQGIGLGLAITRRIVALHGGRVLARNRRGGGLSVRLLLPFVRDQKGSSQATDRLGFEPGKYSSPRSRPAHVK